MSLYEAEFLGTPVPVKRRSKNDIQVPVVKRKRASKKGKNKSKRGKGFKGYQS